MARRKRRRSAARRNAPIRRRRRRRHALVMSNPRRVRRRRRHAVNPRSRRHIRRHRRNPGIAAGGGRGIVGMAIRGLTDGLSVTAGQAITNLAVSKIPFGQATPVGQNALKLAVGLVGAMGVKKFTKSDRVAAFYLAGVTNDIYRHLFAGVPVVGAALAGVGTYPMLTAGRVGTYPRPRALSGYAGAVDGAVVEQYDSSDQHDEDSDQFAVASH